MKKAPNGHFYAKDIYKYIATLVNDESCYIFIAKLYSAISLLFPRMTSRHSRE